MTKDATILITIALDESCNISECNWRFIRFQVYGIVANYTSIIFHDIIAFYIKHDKSFENLFQISLFCLWSGIIFGFERNALYFTVNKWIIILVFYTKQFSYWCSLSTFKFFFSLFEFSLFFHIWKAAHKIISEIFEFWSLLLWYIPRKFRSHLTTYLTPLQSPG